MLALTQPPEAPSLLRMYNLANAAFLLVMFTLLPLPFSPPLPITNIGTVITVIMKQDPFHWGLARSWIRSLLGS